MVREEFSLSAVEKTLKESVTAVIIGTTLQEERCKEIGRIFQSTKAKIIAVDYDHEVERYRISVANDAISRATASTIECFPGFLANKISGYDENVLIDLTSLQHSVIIVLLNILCNQIKPARLFATYIKPERYITRDSLGKYDFTLKVSEPAGIPGLIHQRKSNEIIVPFLGFEGDRLQNIIESMSYDAIVPVIGFPSEDPAWKFDALRNCMQTLDNMCPEAEIKKCKANSIYDAMATLDEINDLFPGKNFVLLPLGIRPHTAACGLWAATHKRNSRVLYDYVVETTQRSKGIGEAIVYHLSKFVRSV